MTPDDDGLPELDVDDSKRVLAAAIGRRLEGIAGRLQEAISDLDHLRRTAGFVNGLAKMAASCKREIEATAEKIRQEASDVKRELQEKPEPVASVDHDRLDAVRHEKTRVAS